MAEKSAAHNVAVVVDPAFGNRLLELAGRVHVWLIDTPANRAAANVVTGSEDGVNSAEHGVTTFSASATEPPDAIVASMLEIIDLHHGRYSHSPPWSMLEVYGTGATPQLLAALADRDFTNISPLPDGFRASRFVEDAG
jgi:hypothetical protein